MRVNNKVCIPLATQYFVYKCEIMVNVVYI